MDRSREYRANECYDTPYLLAKSNTDPGIGILVQDTMENIFLLKNMHQRLVR